MTVTDQGKAFSPGIAAAEAVLALAAYGLPGATAELPRRPLDDDDWSTVAREVARQRLSGLLAATIADGALPVTSLQRANAQAYDLSVAARCLQLEGLLLRAESALSRRGIPVRVIKGPAVAHLDYPDARLRPFIDVDLLVRADDFDAAAECLAAAGMQRCYPEPRPGFDRRFGKGANFVTDEGTAVDLHRTFVMGPYGLRVELADLWEVPEGFRLAGRDMHAMSVEARLLHACFHAVLGDWPRRLLPHRDVAQILLSGRVDERRLFVLSRRWRADALLATGVVGAWDAFGLPDAHPIAGWARRYVLSATDERLLAVYSHPQHSFAAKSLATVGSIPGVRAKAAFVRALAMPDRAYVQHRHGSAAERLLHGLRQVRAR